MIAETFAWWLVIEAVGLIALPLAFVLFKRLPGAGYAFAKPLGLLVTGYLFWLALTAHVLPNRPGSIVWVLLLLVAVDFLILRRRGAEMRQVFESRMGLIIVVEAVFFLALFVGAHIRSYVPEISGTEKPMDFMFLNALDRSRYYPPQDPWLAGFDVSYYYFGYLIQAMVGNLAAVKTSVAFNLGLVSTAALAATAAFGLGYDLARPLRRVAIPAAIGVGIAAAIFVTLLGNLEGVLEFGAANGVLTTSTADSIDIANLDSAQESDACLVPVVCIKYPTEDSSFWWWWRATRIDPTASSITEFPFFSFILGDLHPHVMAIPYVLTAFALGLSFWRSETPLGFDTWRRRPALLLLSAVLVGGLGFLNTWDLPTFGLLIALLVLLRNLAGHGVVRGVLDTLGFIAPLALLAVALYAPFYLDFSSQAQGFGTVQDGATRPLHSALFWGPLFAVCLPLPLFILASGWRRSFAGRMGRIALLPAALLALWGILILVSLSFDIRISLSDFQFKPHLAFHVDSLGDAIAARGWNWLTALFFASALTLSLLALWRSVESSDEDDFALTPALAAMSVAFLLILGAELFYVKDLFGTRLNSVFKLYYQAWLLLAVSGGFSAYWLLRRTPARPMQLARGAATGLAALCVAGGLLYPLGATLSRTGGLGNASRTLDGTRFAQGESSADYAAIQWLRDRGGLKERVLEAVGGSYSGAARVSERTGLATILGWPGHERQWGRAGSLLAQREADVDRAYSTPSLEEAITILRQYGVTYVFVGRVEREKYQPEGLLKFESGLPAVFRADDTVVYRLPVDESVETQR